MEMSQVQVGHEYLTNSGGRIKVIRLHAPNKMTLKNDCVEAVYWSDSRSEWSGKRYTIKPENLEGPWGGKDKEDAPPPPRSEPVKTEPVKTQAPQWQKDLLKLVEDSDLYQLGKKVQSLEEENARLRATVEMLESKLAGLALAGLDDL